MNKREKKNSTAIVISSALQPYDKLILNSDQDGLMCSVEITLPGGSSTVFTSLYSRPRAITRRRLIEINLSCLLSRYSYQMVGEHFNCICNPHLDSLHADTNPWTWTTSKTSGSVWAWIDTYGHNHSTALACTRPPSKNRLDYIFVLRRLFHQQQIAGASALYGESLYRPPPRHDKATLAPHTNIPPPPRRKRFCRIKKGELLRLRGGLPPLDNRCEQFNQHLPDIPSSQLIHVADAILWECWEAYHSIKILVGGTAPYNIQKEFNQLANAVPPPFHPRFGEKMRQPNS